MFIEKKIFNKSQKGTLRQFKYHPGKWAEIVSVYTLLLHNDKNTGQKTADVWSGEWLMPMRNSQKKTLIHASVSHSMSEPYPPDQKAGSSRALSPREGSSSLFPLHKWHNWSAHVGLGLQKGPIQRRTQMEIQEHQCFPMATNGLIIYSAGRVLQCSPKYSRRWKSGISIHQSFL